MSEMEQIEKSLWNDSVINSYDSVDSANEHLLHQYLIYVEMADRISQRRAVTNGFFLSLHTLILAAVGYTYDIGDGTLYASWWVMIPTAVAVALCALWHLLIRSYRLLNSAKYKVIGAIERRLPASPYWAAEWSSLGQGNDPSRYLPLSGIEAGVPIVLGALYAIGGLLSAILS